MPRPHVVIVVIHRSVVALGDDGEGTIGAWLDVRPTHHVALAVDARLKHLLAVRQRQARNPGHIGGRQNTRCRGIDRRDGARDGTTCPAPIMRVRSTSPHHRAAKLVAHGRIKIIEGQHHRILPHAAGEVTKADAAAGIAQVRDLCAARHKKIVGRRAWIGIPQRSGREEIRIPQQRAGDQLGIQ